MSTAVNTPPRRPFYVFTFLISLVIVFGCLAAFLFAVRMESTVAGKGIIRSRQETTLRGRVSGVVELGWYEGSSELSRKTKLEYRVDEAGNGLALFRNGKTLGVKNNELEGSGVLPTGRSFHALKAGDFVWPRQVVAAIGVRRQEVLVAPKTHDLWLVQQVHAEHLSALKAGDKIMTLVPVDPDTREPIELIADVRVKESELADVVKGQTVRIYSNMYNSRLHGKADGEVIWLDPWVSEGNQEGREVRVHIDIKESPFPLRLGSGMTAKIVVGRKPVYRIILEH
ncbi:MAG: HlyD family efflux transporter periplasmic adaptor subunit [Gemmataceae bacterium]